MPTAGGFALLMMMINDVALVMAATNAIFQTSNLATGNYFEKISNFYGSIQSNDKKLDLRTIKNIFVNSIFYFYLQTVEKHF